ncbi:MAG: hypothetical protein ACQCN4_11405 [Candidatus Bathyarchaeia archaeon]
MSGGEVGLPVAVLSLGTVGVPQADIKEAFVHLGCSKEVSSFEVLLENWNGKYSPNGAYPILVGVTGGLGLCRAPNNPANSVLISLKVESVKYETDPAEALVRVSGRCWGEWLFRRVITKTYENVKGEAIIKDLIESFTDLGHVRNGTELVVDTDTTYTKLEYVDTPLWDIVKYIAETSDKAGVIGFDFRVAPDGLFEFFPKNSKAHSISLAEKIEVSEYRKDVARVRNRIKIFGEATKSYPLDKDGFTEILHPSYGDWAFESGNGQPVPSPGVGEIAQDSTVARMGTSSVKVHIENFWGGGCSFTFKDGCEVDFNKYPILFCYQKVQSTWSSEGAVVVTDVNGKYIKKNFNITPDDKWKSYKIGGGAANSDEWDIIQDGFDWTKIKKILFHRIFPAGPNGFAANGWGDWWLDGLYFGGCRYSAMREDASSAGSFGLREYVETDEELWSDTECDLRAKALLSYLKSPAEYLTVNSTVLDYGVWPIQGGDKVHVLLPVEGVDADFRVEYAEYRYVADSQELKVTLELGKEPPQIADYLYGLRTFTVNVEKLARTKRGSKGGATVGLSHGNGSGGTVGYNGVGVLEIRCEVPSYLFSALEPYLWGFDESGAWTPDALSLPLGTSVIRLKDELSLNWLELGLIIAGQDDLGPMLWVSQALTVKKDFACGGMITSFQGALFLGSGLQAETDMPQIILAHSEAAYGNKDTLEVWRFGKPGLAKVKCEELLVNSIKKVNGAAFSDFLIPDAYGYVTISGIHFGSSGSHSWGDIYRSTVNGDDIIVVSGLGLGLDGYLNVKSISLNPPSGKPALASDSSTLVCTGINADLIDGHHASDFCVLDAYGYATMAGIHFGSGWGDIYRSTLNSDKVIVVSGLGLALDGYLNAKSISLNPPTGTPALSSDSSTLVCTGINADLLDGHHATDFLTEIGELALSNMPQGGSGDSGKVLTSQGDGNWPQYLQVDYLLTTVSADSINRGGVTASVAVAKVGGGTRTLHFSNSKYTGYTDS